MVRNKSVLLTLVCILAVASFGFTSFNAVSYGGSYSVAVLSQPVASSNLSLTTSSPHICDADSDGDENCTEGENDGDADDVATALKAGPDLAGFCALHKQPAGTTVASVAGPYVELAYPYYKVVLNVPNGGNPTIYVNGTTCNVIPAP